MKRQTSFLKALGIGEESFVALSGGGGKTSLLNRLFEEAVRGGVRVLASTTAKMMRPDFSENVIISPEIDAGALVALMRASAWKEAFVAGGEEGAKVTSVENRFLDDLKSAMGKTPYLLLVEADGSARKPYRIRNESDPTIPQSATLSVHLIGAEVGQSVLNEDLINRCPEALIEEFPDEALLRALVLKNLPPMREEIPSYLIINKADQFKDGARRLATSLEGAFDRIFISSLREGWIEEVPLSPQPVILAAGLSRRMKTDTPKLLLPYKKKTILENSIEAVRNVSGRDPFLVIRERIMEAVPEGISFAVNKTPEAGMGSSLSLAAREMKKRGERGMLVYLADTPLLSQKVTKRVLSEIRRNPEKIIRPVHGGRVAHPVYFPGTYFDEIGALSGEEAGRAVMRAHPKEIVEVEVDEEQAFFDVDTVEDYEKLISPES